MASKKPLVVGADGLPQQLQAGDTLDAPQSGGDILVQTNDESTPIVIGAPVYNDAADGVKKAKADASGTSNPIGLVAAASIAAGIAGTILISGILSATTGQWDAIAGTTGGLTAGTRYFLSAATSGLLTSTPPNAVGQYIVEVGIAISTTELKVNIRQRIAL